MSTAHWRIRSRHLGLNLVSFEGLTCTSHKLYGYFLRNLIFIPFTILSSAHPIINYFLTFLCHIKAEPIQNHIFFIRRPFQKCVFFTDTLYSMSQLVRLSSKTKTYLVTRYKPITAQNLYVWGVIKPIVWLPYKGADHMFHCSNSLRQIYVIF